MLYYLKNTSSVIDLFGYHIDFKSKKCVIVMEWCSGGDLFDYIQKYINLTEITVKIIIKNIISALLECHKLGICHSDLKLDNIMLSIPDDINSIKLIDFGSSKFIYENDKEIIYKFISTSPNYTPPEVIHKFHSKLSCDFLQEYEITGTRLFKIDVWQIGVITYSLLHGKFPFEAYKSRYKHASIFKKIESCKYPDFKCGALCKDFIKKTMCFNPSSRISMIDAYNHEWLAT